MVFQKKQQFDDSMPMSDDVYVPYGGKEPESYKEVVLRQVEECRKQMSKHLAEGGVHYVKEKGQIVPKNIADQREVNERCVMQLHDLLLWFFDEEDEKAKKKSTVQKDVKEVNETIKKAKEEIIKKFLTHEPNVMYKNLVKTSNELIEFPDSFLSKMLIKQMKDLKDQSVRRIYQLMLKLYKDKNELSKVRNIGAFD